MLAVPAHTETPSGDAAQVLIQRPGGVANRWGYRFAGTEQHAHAPTVTIAGRRMHAAHVTTTALEYDPIA